jgi:1-aminocyclopropane-1-carboxylate deaminase
MIMPTGSDAQTTWDSFSEGPMQLVQTSSAYPDYYVKRLDLLSSWASGNKYYKLKYIIRSALTEGVKTIISKGGMFSNHLAALSTTCKAFNLALIAVVRSYAPDEENPSIIRLRANGHRIIYMPPGEYKMFDGEKAAALFPDALFIPEGGLSASGIEGAAEIAQECFEYKPSHLILAGGSMSTACGILSALPAYCKLVVVPAWKGCSEAYVENILEQYTIQYSCGWELWPQYHFGGFGKVTQELIDFMACYARDKGIPLDPVYTGKLMYAIHDKIESGYFKQTDRIVAIHSGGLQGLEGYRYRFPEMWKGM